MPFDDGPRGRWTFGPHTGRAGKASGFEHGSLLVALDEPPGGGAGNSIVGHPAAWFALDEGGTGADWLDRVVEFPSVETLRTGCLLHSIAHAWWIARNPGDANMCVWDGQRLAIHNGCGDWAVLLLENAFVVALLFGHLSPRNPFAAEDQWSDDFTRIERRVPYRFDDVVAKMPSFAADAVQRSLALWSRTLRCADGSPAVTAAFWSTNETLAAAEPWSRVVIHSGDLLRRQLLPPEEAIATLVHEYEMSLESTRLVAEVFARRVSSGQTRLTQSEAALLMPGSPHIACELLASVGVIST